MGDSQPKKADIFDRLMTKGFLKKLEPFYKAHKEVLLYLFFGAATTVVSVIAFAIPVRLMSIEDIKLFGLTIDLDTLISNVISWICAVTFAYLTNRMWVFEGKACGAAAVAKECVSFFAGRLFTLIVETILLNIMTTAAGIDEVISKIVVSIVTIILNYIISKLFVFKGK